VCRGIEDLREVLALVLLSAEQVAGGDHALQLPLIVDDGGTVNALLHEKVEHVRGMPRR